ncbi:MAG: CotH kinase family protein [Clostridia bacterium]|nr:CotH kinase family protein [Clostridia bacterium]
MNAVRRSVSVFAAAAVLFALLVPFAGAEKDFSDALEECDLELEIGLFDAGDVKIRVAQLPDYGEDGFILFLPADCGRESLTVSFPYDWIEVNGQRLASGDQTDRFSADGVLGVRTPEKEYSLKVVSSAELPSVFIDTQSGSLMSIHADKSHKESAVLSTAQGGEVVLNNAELEFIKGRGNSSWQSGEKRSYNIKFEKKTSFLGMSEAKRWALVGNNLDTTLLHNASAYSAAKLADLPFAVDFRFVDLYVNGIYRGCYLVCERVEVGENRVNINDLDDANLEANPGLDMSAAQRIEQTKNYPHTAYYDIPNDPDDISGGYLLEFEYPDKFASEPESAFVTKNGSMLLLHSPKRATEAEVNYVAGLYEKLEEALLSPDGKDPEGKNYTDYIDVDSFVAGALVYEYAADSDHGLTSWYIYLPQGSDKFYMAPLWDFDQGFENPEATIRSVSYLAGVRPSKDYTSFIYLLCSHRDFVEQMSERFLTLSTVFENELAGRVSGLSEQIASSAAMDRLRWGYEVYLSHGVEITDYTARRVVSMRSDFEKLDELVEQEKTANDERAAREIKRIAIPYVVAGCAAVCLCAVVVVVLKKRKKTGSAPKKQKKSGKI